MTKVVIYILAAIGFVSIVSSCSDSNKGSDGYSFGTPQFYHNDVSVNVTTYNSLNELKRVYRNMTGEIADDNLIAYSRINPTTNHCEIHMVDPAVKYMPEFVGHEFIHCIRGQFHTDNDSRG